MTASCIAPAASRSPLDQTRARARPPPGRRARPAIASASSCPRSRRAGSRRGSSCSSRISGSFPLRRSLEAARTPAADEPVPVALTFDDDLDSPPRCRRPNSAPDEGSRRRSSSVRPSGRRGVLVGRLTGARRRRRIYRATSAPFRARTWPCGTTGAECHPRRSAARSSRLPAHERDAVADELRSLAAEQHSPTPGRRGWQPSSRPVSNWAFIRGATIC